MSPSMLLQQCSALPIAPWRLVPRNHASSLPRRASRLYAVPEPQNPGFQESGDPKLQESLVNQLQLEIGKKQVESFVDEKREGLKQKAEEGKAEFDKIAELAALKSELAFNSALADINKEADEFEEELRKSREALKAEEQQFAQWEQDMAVARSQGQFFQSLYQADRKKPVGEDLQHLKAQAARVQEPAKQELGSTLRLYTFAVSAAVLASLALIDLRSDSPSPVQDVLYIVLALLLTWSSYNERRAL